MDYLSDGIIWCAFAIPQASNALPDIAAAQQHSEEHLHRPSVDCSSCHVISSDCVSGAATMILRQMPLPEAARCA